MVWRLKIPSREVYIVWYWGFALQVVNLNAEEGLGCFLSKRLILFVSRPGGLVRSGHQSQIQAVRWYLGSRHEAFLFLEAALFQLILELVR